MLRSMAMVAAQLQLERRLTNDYQELLICVEPPPRGLMARLEALAKEYEEPVPIRARRDDQVIHEYHAPRQRKSKKKRDPNRWR